MATTNVQQSRRDLSGLWVQGIDEEPNESLGDPATHGTYTRSIYLRLVHAPSDDASGTPKDTSGEGADYQLLYVFDEYGEMARFSWKADFQLAGRQGAWVSANDWVTFHGSADVAGEDVNFSIAPNLALRAKTDRAVPKAYKDVGCPLAFSTPTIRRPVNVVSGEVPRPSGKLNTGMPLEYITVNLKNPKHLTWGQRDATGHDVVAIELMPADVMVRDVEPKDANKTWGDVFQSSTYEAADAVFVGYKPMSIDLAEGTLSGTYPEVWDNQQLSGRRVFEYVPQKSGDFAKSRGGDGKVLPLGTVYIPIKSGTESKSTLTVSSENQHCESTAMTFGLEGGVEGVAKESFSVSTEDKTEESQSEQCRYTLSSDTLKKYALKRHLPNLKLETGYRSDLDALLSNLLSTDDRALPDLEWQEHEGTYGSHYANAVTFGAVRSLKTVLRERTEGQLVEHSIQLKVAAEAAFDGFEGGANAEVKKTWGDSFKDSISQEDLKVRFVGESADPAPIFLDLRAANELLNPILISWSPDPLATTDEMRAPFLWYVLRKSWLDYQRRTHQIDTPLSAMPDVDWSPQIFRFNAQVNAAFLPPNWPSIYGDVTWSVTGGALVAGTAEYHVKVDKAHKSDIGAPVPGSGNLHCTLAARDDVAMVSKVTLNVRLKNWRVVGTDDSFNGTLEMPMQGPDGEVVRKGINAGGIGGIGVSLSRHFMKPAM